MASSSHPELRILHITPAERQPVTPLRNEVMLPQFMAVTEATEEAILHSLVKAEAMEGKRQHLVVAIFMYKESTS